MIILERVKGLEKQKIQYSLTLLSISLLCFVSIVSGGFAWWIVPKLRFLFYGAMDLFFYEIIRTLIWILEICFIQWLCIKLTGFSPVRSKETRGKELPFWRTIAISIIVIGCILIISSKIGWQVKPFYDLGEKFSGYELAGHLAGYLSSFVKLFFAVMVIRTSQEALECLFPNTQNIIWGGIFLFITYGLYEYCIHRYYLNTTYLFINLVYGSLYLLTKKSVGKTYLLIAAIFFF